MNSSASISGVSVVIDGVSYGNVEYGTDRQDACNAIGNYPGCPNVGYTFSFATNALSDGMHSIIVAANIGSTQTNKMSAFFTNNNGNGGSGGSCPSN